MNKIHLRHINGADCNPKILENLTYIEKNITCKKCQGAILGDYQREINEDIEGLEKLKKHYAFVSNGEKQK